MRRLRLTTTLILTMLSATLVHGQEPGKSRFATDRARNRAAIAARDRREAVYRAQVQARAEAEYRAMLPFLMEQQRQEIQRQGEIERNMALHRMAAAAEAEARTNKQRADQLSYYLYYNRGR